MTSKYVFLLMNVPRTLVDSGRIKIYERFRILHFGTLLIEKRMTFIK